MSDFSSNTLPAASLLGTGQSPSVARPRGRRRRPALERFMAKVDQNGPNGCWLWTGCTGADGYGRFCLQPAYPLGAHRVSMLLFRGLAIRPGRAMNLDHLCRVRNCVNPDHLEYVTHLENARRGRNSTTHCVNGHVFDEANTARYPNHPNWRQCRACHRAHEQRRRDLGIATNQQRRVV